MRFSVRLLAALGCLLSSLPLIAQDSALPFRTAIELALKHSTTTGIANADIQRARANYSQARDLYLPQFTIGSGLAFSYGFPLSLEGAAPSIFNFNTQEFLVNFAQRQFVKAAKTDISTTQAQNADRRNDVIMETSIAYMQLDLLQSSFNVQREQQDFSSKYADVVNQRVQAGLDASVELTRAKLAAARTRLEMAETQTAMDEVRLRLSQLTGLPVNQIITSTESIPKLPEVSQDADLPQEAAQKSPAVLLANQAALAKAFRARGEEKQLYPAIDLVAQYAVLARFNNYDQFFQKFQRHNVTLGLAIRFPFFNPAQKAVARAAEADAAKSRKEAEAVKDQVSTDTLRLQRSVRQLDAAEEVSRLEHELAQADVEATHEKIQAGGATLKDEQNAKITEHERFSTFLNSSFELDKAQVQLLRQIGQLEDWALGSHK